MGRPTSDIAFTPSVKAIQTAKGSRDNYAKVEEGGAWDTKVTPRLEAFISELDMFYFGTANAEGQPYIQYRGGQPGFLKVIDEKTLGFADFRGNRQYITTGNLAENPKAYIFLMDYVNSRRMKVWGTAKVVEDDPDLLERAVVFTIEAWDVNCPQHIHKRAVQSDIAPAIEALQAQVRELQEKLAKYEDSAVLV